MRRLRYTTGSPFARCVRIVLHEKSLDYEPIEEITTTSAEERLKDSPTLQVPAFRDGDLNLWDSNIIVDHLMASYPNAPQPEGVQPFSEVLLRPGNTIHDKLMLATLQTLGTSMALISQMKWTGVGIEDNVHVARNAERIQHLLDWFEGELISTNEGFFSAVTSVQDVMLGAWIMFAENRPIGVEWRTDGRSKMAALHRRLSQRPSFIANPIWWWEPGVTGYEADGTPVYA